MFKLSSFLLVLVLSLVAVGVVAVPIYNSGLRIISYGCCLNWVAWAKATADFGDQGWYCVWTKVESDKQRYSGSYDGPLNASASAETYTRPLHFVRPSVFHHAYCNSI